MKRTGFTNKGTWKGFKTKKWDEINDSLNRPRKPKIPSKIKVKKPRKQSISKLKKELWKHFSLYIKNRDKWTCFTCSRQSDGSGMHCGHFIPKSIGGLALYFNENNNHAQCYNCNINLSGNQWEYGIRLGEEIVKELYLLKQLTTQWTTEDYFRRIEHYRDINGGR